MSEAISRGGRLLCRIALTLLLAVTSLVASGSFVAVGAQERLDARLEAALSSFTFRNVGPFRAGGWITSIAVPDAPLRDHLRTIYVGTRNGGIFKTTNNGTTFRPLFDAQSHLSIGALAIAPSEPQTIWAGTGESYAARSSYSGDGIYKSTDGGEHWTNMGLRDTHHIARIVVHPLKPDVVWVASPGHLYSENSQRGVFKTTDGGVTWRRVLFVNPRVGAVDLVVDPSNPDVLLAATHDMKRRGYTLVESGPESAIHRSTDGGETWTRVGGGLPSGLIGRIGLDIHRANPKVVYALVENNNPKPLTAAEKKEAEERAARAATAVYAGQTARVPVYGGEVYRSDDGGLTWRKTHGNDVSVGGKAMYSFSQIRVDPSDPQKLFVISDSMPSSIDGGATWRDLNWPSKYAFPKAFGDFRTIWIDPLDPTRIIAGSDGGLQISYDGGATSDHHPNLPIGEVYGLDVDMDDPYNIYAGLQDHESWKGPSNGPFGSVTQDDWVTTGTQDGMYNRVDRTESRWLYNSFQFGGQHRVDQRLRTKTNIQPRAKDGQAPYRFTWITPLAISPFDTKTIYTGAQMLLRSRDRGDTWEEMSPDLTTNDAQRIANTGPSIKFCTITTISESPVRAGLLWVGTDDGRVHVREKEGASWRDVTASIARAGGPASTWVSRVFASPHDAGTAYVAKTGYRDDDFQPYLFKTTDFGATWTRVSKGLPMRPVNVVVQDEKNAQLLFAGTDGGLYVSVDGASSWTRFTGNLPQVAVHDLVIHPRENDLVVGTYGRSIWIVDIGALREMTGATLDKPAYLFAVEPRPRLRDVDWGNYELYGDRYVTTDNEPDALIVTYWLRDEVAATPKIEVRDDKGVVVREIEGPKTAGLHRVQWGMDLADKKRAPIGAYRIDLVVGDARLSVTSAIRPGHLDRR